MNVRRTIKLLSIAGAGLAAGALVVPGSAVSAGFDSSTMFGTSSWSASTGNISGCPSGFSCTPLVTGNGFLQDQVTATDGSGQSFVRTIVTDTNATGDASSLPFSDVNFVKNDGTSTGIAGKQTINDSSNGTFGSSVNLLTGFAAPTAGTSQVQIGQSLQVDPTPSSPGDEFSTQFNATVYQNSAGTQTGRSMDIMQNTALGPNASDSQVFVIRGRQGTSLTSSGSLTLPVASTAAAIPGNSTGAPTTVSWNSGDDVLLTWVGQTLSLTGLGVSKFGYEGITNNTPTTPATASAFSQAVSDPTTAPFDWPGGSTGGPFGDAP